MQITFAEKLGVEERGGYYDHSGALRDMVQNHTLQLLSLLAMDKPKTFTKDDIRAEKIKVFKHLHKPTDNDLKKLFIRGQYTSGKVDGKKYISYRSEPNVNPESTTETFASGAFFVDSDRFRGCHFSSVLENVLLPKEPMSTLSSSKWNPFSAPRFNQMC